MNCFDCDDGELIHDTYDFKSHGYATPIFDISGRTDWACSMMYRCNKCKAECKGNDGRLLAMLPPQYRNAYPVDPRYAVKKETHLNQSLSRVSDSLMITHGGGEQISLMVSAIRGEFHLDMEEEYYSQSKATQKKLAKPLPPFEDSIGRYGPSGQELRDLKDFAAQSTLLSTGVSDMDRVRREIQGVGATTTVCNDHTYATLRNYIAADIENAKCGHTIGVDSGEIASFVIVPDEKQIHYAHQAEQFFAPSQCVTDDSCIGHLSPRHWTVAKAVYGRYLSAGVVSFSPKNHEDAEKGTRKLCAVHWDPSRVFILVGCRGPCEGEALY